MTLGSTQFGDGVRRTRRPFLSLFGPSRTSLGRDASKLCVSRDVTIHTESHERPPSVKKCDVEGHSYGPELGPAQKNFFKCHDGTDLFLPGWSILTPELRSAELEKSKG